MRNCKRFGRLTACLLTVCLLLTLVAPVLAIPADLMGPELEPEGPVGQTVSLVRLSAYAGSIVIGCLEDDTKLTVLSKMGAYYQIDCYDMVGYIAASQVREEENAQYYVNCTEDMGETSVLPYQTNGNALSIRSQLRTEALKYLGVRYVSGGTSPWGFDCSGLTQYLYRSVDYSIERTVAAQLENGIVIAKEDLQCGDLVFFQNTTGYGHFASHVGIYIGNNQIVHAGDGGVGIADLDDSYFVRHYMCARRVVLTDPAGESLLPAAGATENINGSYWRESSQANGSGNSFSIFPGQTLA